MVDQSDGKNFFWDLGQVVGEEEGLLYGIEIIIAHTSSLIFFEIYTRGGKHKISPVVPYFYRFQDQKMFFLHILGSLKL